MLGSQRVRNAVLVSRPAGVVAAVCMLVTLCAGCQQDKPAPANDPVTRSELKPAARDPRARARPAPTALPSAPGPTTGGSIRPASQTIPIQWVSGEGRSSDARVGGATVPPSPPAPSPPTMPAQGQAQPASRTDAAASPVQPPRPPASPAATAAPVVPVEPTRLETDDPEELEGWRPAWWREDPATVNGQAIACAFATDPDLVTARRLAVEQATRRLAQHMGREPANTTMLVDALWTPYGVYRAFVLAQAPAN